MSSSPRFHALGSGSSTPLSLGHVVTMALMTEYQGIVEQPLFQPNQSDDRCLLLVPVHDVERFAATLIARVYDEARHTEDEPPPADIFCPGCGLLLTDTWCVQEHLELEDGRLKRTYWCQVFRSQMSQLAYGFHVNMEHRDRLQIFNGTALRCAYSSKEHFMARAGNVGPWIRHLLLQQPALHCCPWCSLVLPHNKDLTLHIKAHMASGYHLAANCTCTDIYPLHFLYVRRLMPAASNHPANHLFHILAKWADLTRGLLVRTDALSLAAHKFWMKAVQKNQHTSRLALASHAVMCSSPLGYHSFTVNSPCLALRSFNANSNSTVRTQVA